MLTNLFKLLSWAISRETIPLPPQDTPMYVPAMPKRLLIVNSCCLDVLITNVNQKHHLDRITRKMGSDVTVYNPKDEFVMWLSAAAIKTKLKLEDIKEKVGLTEDDFLRGKLKSNSQKMVIVCDDCEKTALIVANSLSLYGVLNINGYSKDSDWSLLEYSTNKVLGC